MTRYWGDLAKFPPGQQRVGALDIVLLKTLSICMLPMPSIKEVVCKTTG